MSHSDLIAAITAATSHISADIQSRMDVQNAFMQNALAAVVQGQGQVEGEFLLAPGATEEWGSLHGDVLVDPRKRCVHPHPHVTIVHF
jgi:hypothetical protein